MTITLTSAGLISVPGTTGGTSGLQKYLPSTTPSGFHYKNVLHNGDFRVNQRVGSYSTSGSMMTMDRWSVQSAGTGSRTVSRQTTSQFPGVYYRRTMTSAGTYAASTSFEWVAVQAIEGQNLVRLGLGGNSWNKLTVSTWVRASSTGNSGFLLAVQNSAGTWYYCYQMFTINTANKWEYKTATFNISSASGCPEPTNDTNFRMQVYIIGGCNTGYQGGTAGTWTTSTFFCNNTVTNFCASNGATFDIARVQLEPGDVATPYEWIPFAIELQRCQRYYQKSYSYATSPASITTSGSHGYTWTSRTTSSSGYNDVAYYYYLSNYWRGGPMRATPSVIVYAPQTASSARVSMDAGAWTDGAYTSISVDPNALFLAQTAPWSGYGYSTIRGAWYHWVANADSV